MHREHAQESVVLLYVGGYSSHVKVGLAVEEDL